MSPMPTDPVEAVIVVSRGELPMGSLWVVAGEQDAKAKATRTYVLVRLEDTSQLGDLDGGWEQESRQEDESVTCPDCGAINLGAGGAHEPGCSWEGER